jgi:hypothetical protein
MGYHATEILGAKQVAGATVMPKGAIMRSVAGPTGVNLVGGVAGAVLSSTAGEVAKRKNKTADTDSDTPVLGRTAFLSVTDSELALIGIKMGILSNKLSDVIARVPRSDIRSVEFQSSVMSKLTVSFTNDTTWDFEVSKTNGKAAKGIAVLLGAS